MACSQNAAGLEAALAVAAELARFCDATARAEAAAAGESQVARLRRKLSALRRRHPEAVKALMAEIGARDARALAVHLQLRLDEARAETTPTDRFEDEITEKRPMPPQEIASAAGKD